jgi:hypothetical protein
MITKVGGTVCGHLVSAIITKEAIATKYAIVTFLLSAED